MEVTNEEIMDMRESFKKLESEKENLSLQVRGVNCILIYLYRSGV